MINDDVFLCRVCGLKCDDPPWGLDGESPTFDFCACCEAQFGYQDFMLAAIVRYRDFWIAQGAQWDYPKSRPIEWDLESQLAQIPPRFR